jgi:hypothetical protein
MVTALPSIYRETVYVLFLCVLSFVVSSFGFETDQEGTL